MCLCAYHAVIACPDSKYKKLWLVSAYIGQKKDSQVTQESDDRSPNSTPEAHIKGIGYGARQEVEALHPETKEWETCTPYFEKRNIHFYVNKCGFQIDQFWCEYFQPEHVMFEDETHDLDEGPDEMFRFIKVMKP